jgi:hypothetical protein
LHSPPGVDSGRVVPHISSSKGSLAYKAKEAFEQGDYLTGLRRSVEYPSGVTSKPAIEGHFKTGQRRSAMIVPTATAVPPSAD